MPHPLKPGEEEANESDRTNNLSMINTELTAQLMSLTDEFQSYKDTTDKIIADLEARLASEGSGANTPGRDSGSSSPSREGRARSPGRDVKRGATRLAKLGK